MHVLKEDKLLLKMKALSVSEYTQSASLYLIVIGPVSFECRLDIVNNIGPISFCPSVLSRTDILSDTHRSNIGQISLLSAIRHRTDIFSTSVRYKTDITKRGIQRFFQVGLTSGSYHFSYLSVIVSKQLRLGRIGRKKANIYVTKTSDTYTFQYTWVNSLKNIYFLVTLT